MTSRNSSRRPRRYYNAVVRDFNTKTQTFPSVIIARSFGFAEREFLVLTGFAPLIDAQRDEYTHDNYQKL